MYDCILHEQFALTTILGIVFGHHFDGHANLDYSAMLS